MIPQSSLAGCRMEVLADVLSWPCGSVSRKRYLSGYLGVVVRTRFFHFHLHKPPAGPFYYSATEKISLLFLID